MHSFLNLFYVMGNSLLVVGVRAGTRKMGFQHRRFFVKKKSFSTHNVFYACEVRGVDYGN